MATQFQIKRGPSERLEHAEKVKGCWYVTTDTNEVFVCNDNMELVPVISGGVSTYSSITHLPRVGKENIVYFIVDNSGISIYRYYEGMYRKVLDTTLTIKIINGGSAVDSELPDLDN